jgi:hypothetical protein
MAVRHMRLIISLFFAFAACALLGALAFAPDALAGFNQLRLTLGALLALVFAGLNLAKWYAGHLAREQMATPVRRPLQPDPTNHDDGPNPAFDFSETADKAQK